MTDIHEKMKAKGGSVMSFARAARMRRAVAVCLSVAAMTTLAACGDDSTDPDGGPTTSTTTAPTPEEAATAAHQRYWDVYVQMANSGDVDPAAFTGVADGSFVESHLKGLQDQAESGAVRVGEPQFGEYVTEVDGKTATSSVCKDESTWGAKAGGETVPGPDVDPRLVKASLEERDGAWIVVDIETQKEATCP